MNDESGALIGKYRLIARLGEGGMGEVYLAEHVLMGKRVAIKVIRPDVAEKPELVARFVNEARAAARITHPGIVQVFDCGTEENGRAYLAMEFLRGETLGAFLRRHQSLAREPKLMRRIGRDTALAVGAAHASGIIHRDLKPDNLFLSVHHEGPSLVDLKVLDFGVAKLAPSLGEPGAHSTRSGILVGTVTYMSPEQCRGSKAIDGRSDLYALGCIMYEMAAGRPPFPDLGIGETIAAHLTGHPPSLRQLVPSIEGDYEMLVMQMLARDPAARPADMNAVAARLSDGLEFGDRVGPITLPPGLEIREADGGSGSSVVARTARLGRNTASMPSGTVGPQQMSPASSSAARHVAGATELFEEAVSRGSQTTLSAATAAREPREARRGRLSRGARMLLGLAVAGTAAATVVAFRSRAPVPLSVGAAVRSAPLDPVASPLADEPINLEVAGVPPGGRTLLDGHVITLPARVPRNSSEHELRIEAPGFEPVVERIRTERDVTISVSLKSSSTAPLSGDATTAPGKPANPRGIPRSKPARESSVPHPRQGEGARRAKDLFQDL